MAARSDIDLANIPEHCPPYIGTARKMLLFRSSRNESLI
jgi:hypothetical protein